MKIIDVYTIGFTQKKAKQFFGILKENNIEQVIDVRLNNVSQLAAFAKRDDLIFFLKELNNCNYMHMPNMAPTKEILDAYKKKEIDWSTYEKKYNALLKNRKVEKLISIENLDMSCFLCSEPTPENCHRRLLAEYLQKHLKNIQIHHL